MRVLTRLGVGLPLAAIVTLGLTAFMAAMISTEFKAEEKLEVLDFQINPVVEDEPIEIEVTKLDAFKEVEVPPAPPETGTVVTDNVVVLPYVPETITPDIPIDITFTSFIPADTDEQPILRFPPIHAATGKPFWPLRCSFQCECSR
jgi:hypothetical protein